MLRWLLLSLIVVVFDLATKLWVEASFEFREQLPVIEGFFNLTLVYNKGAAFSFLADAGGWQRWFFIVLSIVISIGLLVWLKRLQPHERVVAVGVSLVLGGAIGNLIDRVLYGQVIDFLLFYYDRWSWPAFNVADSTIFLGVVFLLYDAFFGKQPETHS
ncbi:signal peptidase II [Solemya velum gill symbiont]|uniref:signal peptidase II n=1 Tax=Solemya velum gill symbiont TaxID=2340 RepID=UPI000997A7A4|nr:signal peptidase II [Solemya velum gill symbiont]OOZ00114.1 signal peptidase II [Solemya velum gill symbiont]OOZ02274.1 signal peptidase II [Solemya velum gill symbiont]OOZ04632.1 signal peptidase II [Solemya velum gill symbiont]OOZ06872.1 signal peptidase II [Solemya velum gill symbiont]OOZ09054.1 signal peptidase II [Solemya velum gill symbiont]